jgi:hypothetical protein
MAGEGIVITSRTIRSATGNEIISGVWEMSIELGLLMRVADYEGRTGHDRAHYQGDRNVRAALIR